MPHIKDFARICEPLNKATTKNAKYTKGPTTGKALEAFNILKTMQCTKKSWLTHSATGNLP
jgi:hypothetical protein